MATPKKKHLIELMIEAGVKWPDGAEYAAQDKKTNDLCLYRSKPVHNDIFKDEWRPSGLDKPDGIVGPRINLPSICCNWHQTIVTREQYAEAYAATAMTHAAQQEQKVTYPDIADPMCFSCDQAVDAVEWHNPPSIEQLTADYHAKAAEADRLQAVADDALKAADDALLALESAGELIGLVISIDTKPKLVDQQCCGTDWKVGDKCVVTDSPDDSCWVGRECVLIEIDRNDRKLPYRVTNEDVGYYWVRDIRRP